MSLLMKSSLIIFGLCFFSIWGHASSIDLGPAKPYNLYSFGSVDAPYTTIEGETTSSSIILLKSSQVSRPQNPEVASAKQQFVELSHLLTGYANTGNVVAQKKTLTLEGDCNGRLQVFSIAASVLSSANSLNLRCIPESATVLINLAGTSFTINNLNLTSLTSLADKVLFNAEYASSIKVTASDFQGSLLAPGAQVTITDGSLSGQIISKGFTGKTKLLYVPFQQLSIPTNSTQTTDTAIYSSTTHANHAPDCSKAVASPASLWPANHKFNKISLQGISDPDGDSLEVQVRCIFQDEPLNSLGDGTTEYDGQGIGTPSPSLRSERSGTGDGRVYHVLFQASDRRGETCNGDVTIAVPHSKNGVAIDGGKLYQSTTSPFNCNGVVENHVPTITSTPPTTATANQVYHYQIQATDLDGDSLSYEFAVAPSGMTINPLSGAIDWLPSAQQVGTASINITVKDGRNGSDNQSYTITVADQPNRAPTITSVPPTSVVANDIYSYTVIASDPDDDILTFSLVNAPVNMSLDASTHQLRWVTTHGDTGTYPITLRVDDGSSGVAEQNFILSVTHLNSPPQIISIPVTTGAENSAYTYQITATDADNDALSFTLENSPEGMVIDNLTGLVSWAPNFVQAGSYSILVIVKDGANATATQTFYLTIHEQNRIPVFTSHPVMTGNENSPYSYDADAIDLDGNTITYSLRGVIPDGMSINSITGVLSWQPTYEQAGQYAIVVTANDGLLSVEQTFTLSISSTNRAPTAQAHHFSTQEDLAIPVTLVGADADGDAIQYSILTPPTHGVLSGSAPQLVYTPNENYSGEDAFSFNLTDGNATSASTTISIEINAANDAPTFNSEPVTQGAEGTLYHYYVQASDPEGDALAFRLIQAPPGMSIDVLTGQVTWAVNYTHAGVHEILLEVSDTQGAFATQRYSLSITNVNQVPVVSDASVDVLEDGNFQLNLLGSDADGDPLTFTILETPSHGTLSGTAQGFSYQPAANFFGSDRVTYQVSDGVSVSAIGTVAISVTPVNDAPIFSGELNAQALVGREFASVLTVADADGDSVFTYSLLQGPAGLTIEENSGRIAWTPTPQQIGVHPVTAVVQDGAGASTQRAFEITVTQPNAAPQILSTPPLVAVIGQDYRYAINAVDTDALTYTLTSAPANLTLQDNILSWQPTTNDVGDHAISISVSDGTDTIEQSYTLKVVNLPETTPTNWGKDFWFVDDMQGSQLQLLVFISAKVDTQGYVEAPAHKSPGDRPRTAFSVKANQVTVVDYYHNLLSDAQLKHDTISGRGIHIQADDDVTVHVLFYQYARSDAVSLLPTVSLGKEYRLSGYRVNDMSLGTYSILATENDTTITISPSSKLTARGTEIPAGGSYSVTLNRGEVYSFWSARAELRDLTGTKVSANKTVGAFVTHESMNVPYTSFFGNSLSEQLPPLSHWGHHHALVPLYSRYGDLVRVLADTDGTQVSINGQIVRTLRGGEFWEFILSEQQWLESNKPVLVTQFSTSDWYDSAIRKNDPRYDLTDADYFRVRGDAATYKTSYDVTIDPHTGRNYVILMVPDNAMNRIVIDGKPVPPQYFFNTTCSTCTYTVGKLPWAIGQIALSPGTHTISSDVTFGVYENIYGLQYLADPFMTVVPPVELAQNEYIFTAPTGFSRNFINLSVPTDAIASVRLDGEPIDTRYFSPLAGSGYSAARLAVNIGSHVITAAQNFGLMVYGFEYYDAYGMIGGFGAPSPLVPAHFSLDADSLSPHAGDRWCVRTQVLDSHDQPIDNIPVGFTLSGVHDARLNVFSERSGIATYCFNGYHQGEDQLTVTVGGQTQVLTLHWQASQGPSKPPVIVSNPVLYVVHEQPYSYQVEARDPENEALSYRLVQAPEGLQIDAARGEISGVVTVAGRYDIQIEVTDGAGNKALQSYRLVVNRLPIITGYPPNPTKTYAVYFTVTDPDGDKVYFESLTPSPLRINPDTGRLVTTLSYVPAGDYPISIRIWDEQGGYIDYSYVLKLVVNYAPRLLNTTWEVSGYAGETLNFATQATDPNGDPLTYQFERVLMNYVQTTADAVNLTIDQHTGLVTWRPTSKMVGTLVVMVRVVDTWGDYVQNIVYLTAQDPMRGQETASAVLATANQSLTYPVPTGLTGTALTYQLIEGPTGATLSATGTLQWLPTMDQAGVHWLEFIVTNADGGYENHRLPVIVRADAVSPVITSVAPARAKVGQRYLYLLAADEPQRQALTYSLTQAPNGMTITSQGLIAWIPMADQVGWQTVTVRVTDPDGNLSEQTFDLEVTVDAPWFRQVCPAPKQE